MKLWGDRPEGPSREEAEEPSRAAAIMAAPWTMAPRHAARGSDRVFPRRKGRTFGTGERASYWRAVRDFEGTATRRGERDRRTRLTTQGPPSWIAKAPRSQSVLYSVETGFQNSSSFDPESGRNGGGTERSKGTSTLGSNRKNPQ